MMTGSRRLIKLPVEEGAIVFRIELLEIRRLFNSISGLVFNDRNNSATYQSAGPDIPWPSITVYLDANNNQQLDSGETSTLTGTFSSGQAGQYKFDNVGTGTFRIRVLPPANYVQTFPAGNGSQTVSIVSASTSAANVNLGIRDLTQSSRLGGRAYADVNSNGVRDTGEVTLSQVTVWVDLDNDSALDAGEPVTTTDAAGLFQLNPLNPNYTETYHVRAVAPAGLNQTAPDASGDWTVTIDAGNATVINNIFGFDDLTPPSIAASDLSVDALPQKVSMNLSEPNVNGSWTVAFALTVTRLADNFTYPVGSFLLDTNAGGVLSYVASTSQIPAGRLPDGAYRAQLAGGTLIDAAGNVQSAAQTFDFFMLTADANRDRVVDTVDFNILAANFSQSGRTFSQGNFDYDAAGNVDTIDFNLLAARFGNTVEGSGSSAQALAAPMAGGASELGAFPWSTTLVREDSALHLLAEVPTNLL
jgi:hypothetical protein